MIKLDNNSFIYDGTIKTPEFMVIDIVNEEEKVLVEGVDYTLDVDSENSGDEIKTYTIKINGMGNYTGTAEVVWKIAEASYKIDYILNGGMFNREYVTEYTPGTNIKLSSNIQRSGYSFRGWYDNEELSGEAVTEIKESDTGDKVFYAKWVRKTAAAARAYLIDLELQGCGIVKFSEKTPIEGEKVKIEVTPDEGYELQSITMFNDEGIELDLISEGVNKYKFIQAYTDVIVKVSFEKIIEVCNGGINCPSNRFLDVDQEAWYHEAIDYVIENDIMNGVSNEEFNLFGSTTRAMLITVIWRIENRPVVKYAMDAYDVEKDMWYTEAIRWALSENIVKGYENGKMGCNDFVTREQIVTILYRYANYKNKKIESENNVNLDFKDINEISDWANEAFIWAIKNKIIMGRTTTTLVPQGITTRAEVATMIMRFNNMMNEK